MDRPAKRGTTARLACMMLVCVAGTSVAGERQDFLAAESSLKRGDSTTFERLAAGLRDYPLYPYLKFEDLKRRLARAPDVDVAQFLRDHADTPLAERIRRARLEQLADQGRWAAYAELYTPDGSTERHCHFLHALIRTGRTAEVLDQIEPLWLTGRSRPDACDPVFDAWRRAGGLTEDLAWGRIGLAMERGNSGLARYLGRFLSKGEQAWLDRWLDVHRNPAGIQDEDRFRTPHPQRGHILVHGVERLAKTSPRKAAQVWKLLQGRYDFPAPLYEQAVAAVGLALAEDGDRRGLGYLGQIPAHADNLTLQERRLRAALRLDAWPQIGAWVEAMPDGERKAEHWLYWQARALEAQGRRDAAAQPYRQAAQARSLWGFLAAERIGIPYHLEHRPTPAEKGRIARIEQSPAGRRIAELRALGHDLDVRRELHWLTQDMEPEDLMAAAVLAGRWGWPDRAILTLAKSGFWDDLELRFPIEHRDLVRARARATGLAESWIYAILRQESAFNPQAVSPAGALGLMQLMPATARDVARSLDEPSPNRWDLLRPARNIRLGSTYLARMQERFSDNPVLAAAAYNAGPNRVKQWLPAKRVDADIWTATIPFQETRGYVRRVLAYRLIYDHRLGRGIQPLSQIMRPVGHETPSSGADGNPLGASGT